MKKLVVMLMALMLLLTTAVAEADFPLTEEPITLEIFSIVSTTMTDPDTNRMVQEYEKMTNVHIEWIFSQDVDTDLNLMMAGGDIPDIFLVSMTPYKVTALSQAELLLPLNDMIENGTCKYLAQRLEENPEYVDYMTAEDGNIYTFFLTDVGDHNKSTHRMYVYADWLEAYQEATGNAEPATIEEFEQMLIYFRDHDMNGNGDASDEIPFVASTDSFDNPIFYLLSPFTFVSDNFYHAEDEQIVFEANTDGWREGLKWVNHLYNEGLFDAEAAFVQDRTQLRALVNREKEDFLVGSVTSFWQGRFVDTTVVPWTDYTCLAPLAGPDGHAQATTTYLNAAFQLVAGVSTSCEYPEAAARWLDWWLSDEGSFAKSWGMLEGEDYVWVDEPSFSGESRSVVPTESSYNGNYRIGDGFMPVYDQYSIRYISADTAENRATSNTYVLMEAIKKQQPFWVYSGIPQVNWCSDEELTAQVEEYRGLFNEYIQTSFTEFVLGLRDVNDDAQWAEYLQELEDLGLNEYCNALNMYYFGT